MIIECCLGSACHVKGANKVFLKLQDAIKENNLSDKITVKGAMCLGRCGEPGANLRIDGNFFSGITVDNFDEFFTKEVVNKLQ